MDVPGELANSVLDWRVRREPKVEEEMFVLDRFLDIVADIVTLLSRIGVPEKYITAMRREDREGREGGYRDTFYGRLINAKQQIVRHRLELRQMQFGQRLERRFLPAPSEGVSD